MKVRNASNSSGSGSSCAKEIFERNNNQMYYISSSSNSNSNSTVNGNMNIVKGNKSVCCQWEDERR